MSENYKPGTVAVATLGTGLEVRVMWVDQCRLCASYAGGAGHWHGELGGNLPGSFTAVRPLVVLDLAAANTYITEAEVAAAAIETLRASDNISDSGLADQIEAQARPPKPAEPTGLGAVVEDAKGVRWVLNNPSCYAKWSRVDAAADGRPRDYRTWLNIDVTRVLSEGVEVDR